MKNILLALLSLLSLFYSKTEAPHSSLFGRFTGRTPCQEIAREWRLSRSPECFKIKWSIRLYQDSISQRPTTFKIDCTFDRTTTWEGQWTISKGIKSNPDATVVELTFSHTDKHAYFYLADKNVLFFLDSGKNLIPGNPDFSYTLNRTD